jgi:hypothetical protein
VPLSAFVHCVCVEIGPHPFVPAMPPLKPHWRFEEQVVDVTDGFVPHGAVCVHVPVYEHPVVLVHWEAVSVNVEVLHAGAVHVPVKLHCLSAMSHEFGVTVVEPEIASDGH